MVVLNYKEIRGLTFLVLLLASDLEEGRRLERESKLILITSGQ